MGSCPLELPTLLLLPLLLPFPPLGLEFLPSTFFRLKWPADQSLLAIQELFLHHSLKISSYSLMVLGANTFQLLCRNQHVSPERQGLPKDPAHFPHHVFTPAWRSVPSMHKELSECWLQRDLHFGRLRGAKTVFILLPQTTPNQTNWSISCCTSNVRQQRMDSWEGEATEVSLTTVPTLDSFQHMPQGGCIQEESNSLPRFGKHLGKLIK